LNAGVKLRGTFQNVQVYNNLWANNRVNQIEMPGSPGVEHDYNAFHDNLNLAGNKKIDDDEISEPHKQLVGENPFVAPEDGDLRLRFATDSGLTLPAPFDRDPDSIVRGGDGVWDRGAFEFRPSLMLHGAAADRAINLTWTVNTTLPVTATWHIDYYITSTNVFTATEPLSITRARTLTDLTNGEWYTVTLYAMGGTTSLLSDTVRVMPTDIFVYLPLALKDKNTTMRFR
jgi:hypothetical protein